MAFKFSKKVVFATDRIGWKTITYQKGMVVDAIPEKLKYQLDKDKKNGPFYEKIKNSKQEADIPEAQKDEGNTCVVEDGMTKATWGVPGGKVKPGPKKKRGRKKG